MGQFGGRIIEYETTIAIGGKPDPQADRAARKQAYRESVEFAERSCRSNPDKVEKLSGHRMTPEARARSVASCLREMAASRREMVAQGLIEP
jgi:hypothetical protein